MKFFKALWAAIRPAATILGSKTGQALLQIAIDGFREAYANDALKTDAERREYVLRRLRESDLASGNVVADTAIQIILIEAQRRYGQKK